MASAATECLTRPGQPSFWIESEGRYICLKELEGRSAPEVEVPAAVSDKDRLDPKFKLVFGASVVGTLLFTSICVALHLATTGEPPPLREKLIENFFTMANIGFGAIVGLLGGKTL